MKIEEPADGEMEVGQPTEREKLSLVKQSYLDSAQERVIDTQDSASWHQPARRHA